MDASESALSYRIKIDGVLCVRECVCLRHERAHEIHNCYMRACVCVFVGVRRCAPDLCILLDERGKHVRPTNVGNCSGEASTA